MAQLLDLLAHQDQLEAHLPHHGDLQTVLANFNQIRHKDVCHQVEGQRLHHRNNLVQTQHPGKHQGAAL